MVSLNLFLFFKIGVLGDLTNSCQARGCNLSQADLYTRRQGMVCGVQQIKAS